MKKRAVIFALLVAMLGSAAAQDTIRYGDPWYLFHEYTTIEFDDVLKGTPSGNQYERYSLSDSGTYVYGIAFTCVNFPLGRSCSPGMYLYRQLSGGTHPTALFIDSACTSEHVRMARFTYEFESGDSTFPCYEFYFDTPHGFDELSHDFFISRYWPTERLNIWLAQWNGNQEDWFCQKVGITPEVADYRYWGTVSEVNYYSGEYNTPHWWGGLFPIVQLRCITPELCLEGRGHRTATVSWRTAEQPEMFELAIGDYMAGPEAATIVTVDDSLSSYTFTDLDTATMLGVWVRKGCRYTTSGYDMLVYSDWSQPLGFTALGIGEAERDATFSVSPNPTHGRVTLTLAQALTAEGELTLCDLGGREVRRLTVPAGSSRVTLDTEGCPAGAYLLKLVTPHGVATRRLLVE